MISSFFLATTRVEHGQMCIYRLRLEWENLRDHASRSVERTPLIMSRNRRGYRARAQPCAKNAFGVWELATLQINPNYQSKMRVRNSYLLCTEQNGDE